MKKPKVAVGEKIGHVTVGKLDDATGLLSAPISSLQTSAGSGFALPADRVKILRETS